MSLLRVNTILNRTGNDKVTFPFGIGVTNGIQVAGVVTATAFVGSGVSLTGVQGTITVQGTDIPTLTGITTIAVGSGLTYTQPSAGIASIGMLNQINDNPRFVNLKVTGISTFGTAGLTTVFSTGQIRSQASGNLIRNSFTLRSDLTGTLAASYAGGLAHAADDNELYLATASGVWDRIAQEYHTAGIITSTNGFSGGTVGFHTGNVSGNVTGDVTGNINGATGVSTLAQLKSTTAYVSAGATVGTDLAVNRDLTVFGGITGAVNNTGVGTVAYFQGTNINITGILTAGSINGSISQATNSTNAVFAEVATYAGIATQFSIIATNTTNASHFPVFVDAATGNENPRTDTGFTFNPFTNTLSVDILDGRANRVNAGVSTINQLLAQTVSATGIVTATGGFSGALTGNVTGNVTGNATGLSGSPTISVSGITASGDIMPDTNNSRNLGAPATRWANVYANDMHFSNEGSENSVDGTWGDWTLQEGENDIFMLNNRTGKKFKINLTEI
jgi:hypothetical protein